MEIAGTPHPGFVFAFTDAPAQNPAGCQPVARASLRNLIDWIRGRTPPDSNYITLAEEVGDSSAFRSARRSVMPMATRWAASGSRT